MLDGYLSLGKWPSLSDLYEVIYIFLITFKIQSDPLMNIFRF